jgi:hypothetical protein
MFLFQEQEQDDDDFDRLILLLVRCDRGLLIHTICGPTAMVLALALCVRRLSATFCVGDHDDDDEETCS